MRKKLSRKNSPIKLAAAIGVILTIIWILLKLFDFCGKIFYPIKYKEYVELYSAKYGMDKYFIYSVIKTESNFNEKAESNVGARGLMQIMNDAFDWIKYRMSDSRDISYDDMFKAEYNIEYGTYMLKLLTDEYGDYETALAAYHAGRTTVNNWLSDEKYSSDGKTLKKIPSKTTAHYVEKVMKAYKSYTNIYNKE
ncbi:MAG: hypothetical protein JG769_258 [Oscillospiraceae bacterium]|jgi:soluble lytic murein transglycosylase|nr:hypothetical protein [Oscillospiraceae bacterium]